MRAQLLATLLAGVLSAAAAHADDRPAGPLQPSASWDAIRSDVAGPGALRDAGDLYALEAPFRAQDAATVPIRFVQAAGAPDVARLTIVVDENPAPVAATFDFGPAMLPVDLELRVRVDAYTNVRAIVETTDGTRYMTGGFVRAAGGCSAPALKDAAAAAAALGQMRVRWVDDEAAGGDARQVAQVMLRHPNYSGMQRDPLSQLFIPAHFVDRLEVRQGEDLLFAMTGGISISEDPTFRFAYAATGAAVSVAATDTDGGTFAQSFPFGL